MVSKLRHISGAVMTYINPKPKVTNQITRNHGIAQEGHHPPFHTGTAIRIVSEFRRSHGHVYPDSIRIKTRIADPAAE